jgi:hypothetical protein
LPGAPENGKKIREGDSPGKRQVRMSQVLICRSCGARAATVLAVNEQELANVGMLERRCNTCAQETTWGLAQDYRRRDRRAVERRAGERRRARAAATAERRRGVDRRIGEMRRGQRRKH